MNFEKFNQTFLKTLKKLLVSIHKSQIIFASSSANPLEQSTTPKGSKRKKWGKY
jgi:hypothetical protein